MTLVKTEQEFETDSALVVVSDPGRRAMDTLLAFWKHVDLCKNGCTYKSVTCSDGIAQREECIVRLNTYLTYFNGAK